MYKCYYALEWGLSKNCLHTLYWTACGLTIHLRPVQLFTFFLICIWLFVIVNDPKILNCQWRKPLTLAQLHSERLRHYGSQQQKHTKVCKILAFGFIGKSTWSPCTIDQINSCTHCEIEKWKMELYVCMCVWRMEKRMVFGAQRINDYRTHGSKQICYNP